MQHAEPLVTVVIPTLDPQRVESLVTRCSEEHIPCVVVHPGPALAWQLPGVRSLSTATRVSPAAARNMGAQTISTPVVCFVDDDVDVSAQTIALLAHTCAHESVVAAVPWLTDAAADGYWRRCMHRVMQAGHMRTRVRNTDNAYTSMCLAVRRAAFWQVGGFSLAYDGPAGEDTALVQALAQLGEVSRVAGATMHHDPQPDGWWPASRRLFRYGRAWPRVAPQSRGARWARWCRTPWRRAVAAALCWWIAAADVCVLGEPRYRLGGWWLRWCWYLGVIAAAPDTEQR